MQWSNLMPVLKMERAIPWINFVSQGLSSNFWGLGCPAHCTSPPVSAFALAFILGWISGLLTFAYLLGLVPQTWIPASASARGPVHRAASLRLSRYLRERGLSSGRHWLDYPLGSFVGDYLALETVQWSNLMPVLKTPHTQPILLVECCRFCRWQPDLMAASHTWILMRLKSAWNCPI